MPINFVSGRIVSVPCEIAPGMASNEREIRVKIPEGTIHAFVSRSSVSNDPMPDSEEKRVGRVRAVLISFSRKDVRLLFAGQDVDPSNPAPVSTEWLRQNATVVRSIHDGLDR